jgi:hypothetical protein
VIEDLDFEETPGPDQVTCDADIGLGRGGISAGMIVGEDDGMGIGTDGGTEDLPCVDEDLIEEAFGDCFDTQETASGIEKEHMKTFDTVADGFVTEEGGDSFGMIEWGGFLAHFLDESAGESEGGLETDGFVATDAGNAEIVEGGARHGFEAAKALKETIGNSDGGGTLHACSEENGQQFGGSQTVWTLFSETFPWAVPAVEIGDFVGNIGIHGLRRLLCRIWRLVAENCWESGKSFCELPGNSGWGKFEREADTPHA